MKSFEERYFELEEYSWWCRARRDAIIRLVKTLKISNNSKILEIGCSSGTLTKVLGSIGFNVYGIDRSKIAINLCKKRGLKNVFAMDGTKTRFGDAEFDAVIASDVLEHIKDERAAMNDWRRILKPRGILIIFVPAFKLLWSEHDENNRHYRRYSKDYLIGILKKSNFNVERASYWNFTLFFQASLVRIFQHIFMKRRKQSFNRLYDISPVANSFLVNLLKLENAYLEKFDFPVGVSIFAIARK